MKTIIQRIESGDLSRSTDIAGAGGFWDYAGTLFLNGWYSEEMNKKIFNALWDLYEETTNYVDPADIPF